LRLHELRDSHPNDGYRRMTLQLQAEGFHVNRKRIARLMALHSLTKRQSRPDNWTVRPPQLRVPIANLRETARLTGPYQVWVTDVAYGHIRSGLVYAAAVIDAWSREVVGYAASLQITNRLARIALHSAVRAHRPAPGLDLWNAIPHPQLLRAAEAVRAHSLSGRDRGSSCLCFAFA